MRFVCNTSNLKNIDKQEFPRPSSKRLKKKLCMKDKLTTTSIIYLSACPKKICYKLLFWYKIYTQWKAEEDPFYQ